VVGYYDKTADEIRFEYVDILKCSKKVDKQKLYVRHERLNWGWTVLDIIAGTALTAGGTALLVSDAGMETTTDAYGVEENSLTGVGYLAASSMVVGLTWGTVGVLSAASDHHVEEVKKKEYIPGSWTMSECSESRIVNRTVNIRLNSTETGNLSEEATQIVYSTETDQNGTVRIPVSKLRQKIVESPVWRENELVASINPMSSATYEEVRVKIPIKLARELRDVREERRFQMAMDTEGVGGLVEFLNNYEQSEFRGRAVSALEERLGDNPDLDTLLKALASTKKSDGLLRKYHSLLAKKLKEEEKLSLFREYVAALKGYRVGSNNASDNADKPMEPYREGVLRSYVEEWAEDKMGEYIEGYNEKGDRQLPDELTGLPFLKKQSIERLNSRVREFHLQEAQRHKRAYMRGGTISDAKTAMKEYEFASEHAKGTYQEKVERMAQRAVETFRRETRIYEVESTEEAHYLYGPTTGESEYQQLITNPMQVVGERFVFLCNAVQKISATEYRVNTKEGVSVIVEIINDRLKGLFQRNRMTDDGMYIYAVARGTISYETEMGETFTVAKVDAYWVK
jgi:hypothetical protein